MLGCDSPVGPRQRYRVDDEFNWTPFPFSLRAGGRLFLVVLWLYTGGGKSRCEWLVRWEVPAWLRRPAK